MSTSNGHREPGQRVAGRYELIGRAGAGGMAVVWRGIMHGAAGFSRPVALKQIKPQLAKGERHVAMFVEEARLGAQLLHPNIALVFDFVKDSDESLWLVTEWVEGLDMGSLLRAFRLRRERVPWTMVALVGVGALRGLAAAHDRIAPDGAAAPVIHRDISPQNILLGIAGAVKLSDFGLARALDRRGALTIPGFIKGKVAYLSPERVSGGTATPQSDVFSMGALLWEALAGQALFKGSDDRDVLRQIHRGEVPSLEDLRPNLPRFLVDCVGRALARDPADRHASAAAMALDLESVLAGSLSGGLEGQLRLGRAVAEARRQLRRPQPPAPAPDAVESTSRLDVTRGPRG